MNNPNPSYFHELKKIPKIDTEINLLNTMVHILNYEHVVNPDPNPMVIKLAKEILENKLLDISKTLKNPGPPTKFNDETDLIK
jgi:hypothetical protein